MGRPSSVIVSEDGIELGLEANISGDQWILPTTGQDPYMLPTKVLCGMQARVWESVYHWTFQSDALSDLGWRFVEYVFVRG